MADIKDVQITDITTYPDDRGYFREIFRTEQAPIAKIAQASATMSYPGVIKAFHYHNQQDDMWYCADGMIQAVLYDMREDSPTKGEIQVVVMGEHKPLSLYIPKGVAHGYKVLGNKPAMVLYATDREYNPEDEIRIAHDDESIGFDWSFKPR